MNKAMRLARISIWSALLAALLLFNVTRAAAASRYKKEFVARKGYTYWYDKNGNKVRNKIKKIKGYYYAFDSKGRMITNQFIQKKYLYYAGKKGRLLTRWHTIGEDRYYFDDHGRALTGMQKIRSKYYYFLKDGKMQTGWQIINGKKYYFEPVHGRRVRSKVIDGVRIAKDGTAPLTMDDRLYLVCSDLISRICTDSMTKEQKLLACFQYMSSRSNFSYRTWRQYSYYDGWYRNYAMEMLQNHCGNCYNFSCAFAYLAKTLGFRAQLVRGKIKWSGSRAQDANGYTPHCWVLLDGRNYDPEGKWQGFAYVYDSQAYPLPTQVFAIETI